jgi:hypothetical protein
VGTVSPDVPPPLEVLGVLVLLLLALLPQAAATTEVTPSASAILMGREIRALVVIIPVPPLT